MPCAPHSDRDFSSVSNVCQYRRCKQDNVVFLHVATQHKLGAGEMLRLHNVSDVDKAHFEAAPLDIAEVAAQVIAGI